MIISFLGSKGGTGKSTLSALFADILSQRLKRKIEIACVDHDSVLDDTPVKAVQIDDKDDTKQVLKFADKKKRILIVDGIANSSKSDKYWTKKSDFVFLPFTPDERSLNRVLDDLGNIEGLNTWLIPNQISSNRLRAQKQLKLSAQILKNKRTTFPIQQKSIIADIYSGINPSRKLDVVTHWNIHDILVQVGILKGEYLIHKGAPAPSKKQIGSIYN